MIFLSGARKIVNDIIKNSINNLTDLDFSVKIYLYGSVVKNRSGNDIDIIIEVSSKVFKKYKKACRLDGVFPFSDCLVEDPCDLFWTYFSPLVTRTERALEMINVKYDITSPLFSGIRIDVICLPKGWNNCNSKVFKALMKEFKETIDPNFLINASKNIEQLFPS